MDNKIAENKEISEEIKTMSESFEMVWYDRKKT